MTKRALQTSSAPTRKLTAAGLATLILAVARMSIDNLAPEWSEPAVWEALYYPLVAVLAGWFVKDNPNIAED